MSDFPAPAGQSLLLPALMLYNIPGFVTHIFLLYADLLVQSRAVPGS